MIIGWYTKIFINDPIAVQIVDKDTTLQLLEVAAPLEISSKLNNA